jgi:hypothetical protein
MGKVEYKATIARHIFPRVIQDVDGFWKWFPEGGGGCYEAAELEMISSLLNEANRLWDKEIEEYFATHPKTVEPHVAKELDTPWGKLPVIEF